jgi:threonine/homoserine/homoserine lactone efflux protein
MDFIPFFLQGAALGLTAAGSPGAFQAYLINQSLSGGWRRGALVALRPLISDPPIALS